MKHPNGFEVYLKPAGKAGEEQKFIELAIPHGLGDDRDSQCFIQHMAAKVMVVVRFDEELDMQSASALSISVSFGGRKLSLASQRHASYRIGPRAMMQGPHTRVRAKGREDFSLPAPTRGKTGDINNPHREYRGCQFQPLDGDHGRAYRFEFRCLSQDHFSRQAKSAVAGLVVNSMVQLDDEYIPMEQERLRRLIAAMEAWQKTLESRKTAPPSPAETAPTSIEPTTPETASQDLGHHDDEAAQLCHRKVEPTRKGKAKTPVFCDCPVQHPGASKSSSAWKPKHSAGKPTGRPASKQRPETEDSDSQSQPTPRISPQQDSKVVEGSTAQVSTCMKCKGLKVARAKRPAYVHKWQNSDVEKEGTVQAVSGECSRGVVQSPLSQEKPAAASEDGKETAIPGQAIEAAQPSVAVQNYGVGEEQPVEARTPGAAHTQSETARPRQLGSDEGSEGRSEDALVGQSDSETATETSTEHVKPPSEDRKSASRKRGGDADVASAVSKKRRIDIDLTADVDEDAGEVQFKQERSVAGGWTGWTGISEAAEEDGLQERLKEIELQKKEVQLEREKMKVDAQLRALRRSNTARRDIKVEEVIKVED